MQRERSIKSIQCLARAIASARKKIGKTQDELALRSKELAKKIGVPFSQQTFRRYEAGQVDDMGIVLLASICRTLNLDLIKVLSDADIWVTSAPKEQLIISDEELKVIVYLRQHPKLLEGLVHAFETPLMPVEVESHQN